MSSITERQAEYIKILSSYEYSKISQLTKRQASELIQILLRRPTEYTFVCGRKTILNKRDVNGFNVLGFLEGCLHACPNEDIAGDVNNCPDFKDQEQHSD